MYLYCYHVLITLAILSKKEKFKKLKIRMDLIYILILIYIQMTNAHTEHRQAGNLHFILMIKACKLVFYASEFGDVVPN